MRFPFSLTRWQGTAPSGGVALGSDSAPSVLNSGPADCHYDMPGYDSNGNPVKAVYLAFTAPATATATVKLYAYEDATEAWYLLATSTATPTGTMKKLLAIAPVAKGQNTTGAYRFFVLVSGVVTPDGKYVVSLAPAMGDSFG